MAKVSKENLVNKDKLASLKATMAKIEKDYGTGTISMLGDKPHKDIKTSPSGSLALDMALGGGYAIGRIVEIYGAESSGKTTFAIHAMAECQKAGGIAAFVDAEHAFDPKYAEAIGVDIDALVFSQPDYGEQALEIVEQLVLSGAVNLIVIDSVAALTPKAEIEGNMGDSFMGLQARLMSQALRKLTGIAHKNNTTLIFINQVRSKIGVMFGNPNTTTGGNALKFYASQRLEVSGTEKIEGKDNNGDKNYVAKKTKVKVVKNKVAPPFREAELEIEYGIGISKLSELLDIGVRMDIVKKAGAFYSYEGTKLGQGKENSKAFLSDKPELVEEISTKIKEAILAGNAPKKQEEEENFNMEELEEFEE